MRSIYRIRGVILASIGVLLGVMLAVSPGRALAASLDVLTINGTDHFLDETVTSSITVTLPLLPGEPPVDLTIVLTEPTFIGPQVVSDILQVNSSFIGPGQFAETFTFTSDSNSGGLQFPTGAVNLFGFVESASGSSIGPGVLGSLGVVTITSDLDARNVPEPSTWLLLLLGCGMAGLAAWRWKHAV
jgi:hypothetical protein